MLREFNRAGDNVKNDKLRPGHLVMTRYAAKWNMKLRAGGDPTINPTIATMDSAQVGLIIAVDKAEHMYLVLSSTGELGWMYEGSVVTELEG